MNRKEVIFTIVYIVLIVLGFLLLFHFLIGSNDNPYTQNITHVSSPIIMDGVKLYDLSKAYNFSSKTLSIKNGTTTIVDITLITDNHNLVPVGKDIPVADFDFNIYRNVSNLVNIIESYDKNGNMRALAKNYTFKYARNINQIVNDYKITCSAVPDPNLNGTYQNCTSTINGTKTIRVQNWTKINWNQNIPAGDYEVAMFTDVNEGDYVEWIPNIGNLRVSEWANFEAYSLLYKHDTGDSTTASVFNTQWNCQNFTFKNGDFTLAGVSTLMYLVGSPIFIANITIKNSTSDGNPSEILAMNQSYPTSTIGTGTSGTWVNVTFDRTPTLVNNTPYFICIQTNDSGSTNYLRWRINTTATFKDTNGNPGGVARQSINNGQTWGIAGAGQSELYRIYGTQGSSDTIYPTFTNEVKTPNATAYSLGRTYDFDISVLNTNGSVYMEFGGANYSLSNNTISNYTKTFTDLKAGVYSYYYWGYGNGTTNNFNRTRTFSYTIAKASSTVKTYLGGVEGDNGMLIGNSILANGTLASGIMISLNMTFDGIQVNFSTTSNLTYTFTATGSPRTIVVNTSYPGNENYSQSSESWNLQLNNHIPLPSNPEVSPTSPTSYNLTQIYVFNITVTDAGNNINKVLLVFNNTNFTATNISSSIYNYSFVGLKAGNYSYYWYANDTLGDSNKTTTTSIFIAKANVSLSITIAPGENVTTGIPTTVTGLGCVSAIVCNLTRNGVETSNPETTTLTDGLYYYNFSTNGNENYTALQSGFKLLNVTNASTDYPQFFSLSSDLPSPQAYNGTQLFYFNSTWIDSGGNNSFQVLFYWNGTQYPTQNISSIYYVNITDYRVGNYTYYWFANDTGGNSNQTGNLSFSITKATPTGLITILPSTSVVNGTTTNASGTESNRGDGDVTYVLKRDSVAVTNPDVETFLTNGTRVYEFYATGNGENYSSNNLLLTTQSLFVTLTSAFNFPTRTFNNSLASENLTFTANGDIIRYVAVPQNYKTTTTAIMNLSFFRGNASLRVLDNFSISSYAPSSSGLWSNGTDIWLTNSLPKNFFHVNLTGAIISNFSSTSVSGWNSDFLKGIWSNGTDLWFYGWSSFPGANKWGLFHTNTTGGLIEKYYDNSVISSDQEEVSAFTSNNSNFWIVTFAPNTDFNTTLRYLNRTGGIISSYQLFFTVEPTAIYNNGTNLFIGDYNADRLYITNLTGGLMDSLNIAFEPPNSISGVYSNGTNFWISDDTKKKVYNTLFVNPQSSVSLNVTLGGVSVYQNSSFNFTNARTNNFKQIMNNYLANCTFVAFFCEVPITFHSDNAGIIQYSDMYYSNQELNENSINITTPLLSGSTGTITGNFSTGFVPTNITLTYNGVTSYPSVTSDGTYYLLSSPVTAPIVNATTNISAFFTFLINGLSYNSSVVNQSVIGVNISTNCVGNFPIINITNYDEESLTGTNGTVEFTIGLFNGNTQISQFNGKVYGSNVTLCSSVNINTTGTTFDLQLRYYSNTTMYKTYNIQDSAVNNLPISIPLYFLLNSTGTRFNINYVDFNYLTHPNAIIQIQRQYIPQNVYNVVEIPLIANDGTAQGSFNTNNIRYKLIVIENGQVLDTFNNIFPVCQSVVLGTCNINIRGSQGSQTQTSGDFTYNIVNSNNSLILTYVIPSGIPKTVTFSTAQSSRFINNVSTCSQTLFASGGTLTCTYNETVGDSLNSVEIDVNSEPVLFGDVPISENLNSTFLGNNYFIGFILLLTLALIFITSGTIMIIVLVVGLLFNGLIFLIKGAGIGVIATSVAWLIVAIILVLYKINSHEEKYI